MPVNTMKESEYETAINRVRDLSLEIYTNARSACEQLALWSVEAYRRGELVLATEFAVKAKRHLGVVQAVVNDIPLAKRFPGSWESEVSSAIAAKAQIAAWFIIEQDDANAKYWADSVAWWQANPPRRWEPADTATLAACVTERGAK